MTTSFEDADARLDQLLEASRRITAHYQATAEIYRAQADRTAQEMKEMCGHPSPLASPAPTPEPTLAQRLEAMPPDEFFKAMQSDPQGMLARLAQADAEG